MNIEEHPHEQQSLRDQKIVFEESIKRQSYQTKALVGKIWCTQKKSIGTFLCQILTPLLCLLFTSIVTMIVKNNISTKIAKPSFPQPFNIPGTFLNKPEYQTTCDQFYYYSSNGTLGKSPQSLLQRANTKYCSNVSDIRPKFYRRNSTNEMNDEVLSFLRKSDDPSNSTDEDAAVGIPDGMMTYNQISSQNLSVTLAINDMRIGRYHRSNGITRLLLNEKQSDSSMINSYLRVTEGAMSLIDLVTKTYLNSYVGTQVLSSSFMYMPFKEENSFVLRCINVIGNSLNPMAISLLIPMILYFLVSERQSGLLEMMRINGLNMKYYWLINYLFYTILSLITFSIFYLFGALVFKIQLFISTSPVLFCLVLFGWAISQVSLSSFLQLFLQKSKSALIIGYSIAIFATLVGQILSTMIFPFPSRLPLWMLFFPPFAISRVFYLMSFACANGSCYSNIRNINKEMMICILVLYISTFIFPLTVYLADLYEKFSQKLNVCWNKSSQPCIKSKSKHYQDQTVNKQKQTVQRLLKQQLYSPLIVNNVTKKYDSLNGAASFSLQSTSLNVNQNQVLGLLGPSGSGKTTLISLITGTINQTSGNLYFDGEIPDKKLNKQIGACPQFDLLWPQLSPKEHLIFYSRLKGVKQDQIEQVVSKMLQNVDLKSLEDRRVSSLSGGMKRRLSIAIALSGSPRIVLLDEPASGLDPEHRRQLWDIILNNKAGKVIVLTTHSLQQAQVLCSRVGILISGRLRCIGKIPDLKVRLGKGYNLSINMKKSSKQYLEQNVKQMQQIINNNNITLLQKHQFHRTLNYYIDRKQANLVRLFELLIRNKDGLNIEDWSLQQPSLYDVFIRLVDESELDQQ